MDDSLPDGWHAGEYDTTGGCDGDGAELCLAFQSRAAHARASRDSGNARGGADDDDNSARAPLGPAFVRSFNTRGLLEWRSAAAGVVLANEGHATSVGSRNETEVRDDYEAMLRILPMKFGALLLFQYVFLWCFSFLSLHSFRSPSVCLSARARPASLLLFSQVFLLETYGPGGSIGTKKKWFSAMCTELMQNGGRAQIRLQRGDTMLNDSFAAVMDLCPQALQGKFSVVFKGESGVDAGGLLTDWVNIIITSLFDPATDLFELSQVDSVAYQIKCADICAADLQRWSPDGGHGIYPMPQAVDSSIVHGDGSGDGEYIATLG